MEEYFLYGATKGTQVSCSPEKVNCYCCGCVLWLINMLSDYV